MTPKKVETRLTALEMNAKATMEVLKRVDERTEALDHTIRGNGMPGLATDIQLLKQSVHAIKDQLKIAVSDTKTTIEKKSDHHWQLWAPLGSMLVMEAIHWILAK